VIKSGKAREPLTLLLLLGRDTRPFTNELHDFIPCFVFLFMVLLSRVVLFLIPAIVTACILHDHALYFPADSHQPTDRTYR